MDKETKDGLEAALTKVAQQDIEGILVAEDEYDRSWCRRGGQGAFFTLARALDRLPVLVARQPKAGDRYDIFQHCIESDGTGVLDSVRDLRRYLLLVESELVRRGHKLPLQRHNVQKPTELKILLLASEKAVSIPEGTSKDPVCGRVVAIDFGVRTVEYLGLAYYFCGRKCAVEFTKTPAEYAMDTKSIMMRENKPDNTSAEFDGF